MDRGDWGATVHGVAKSRTRLSNFTHSFTHNYSGNWNFTLNTLKKKPAGPDNFTHKLHQRFKELHKFYTIFSKITENTFLFLSQYYLSKSKKANTKRKVQPTSH